MPAKTPVLRTDYSQQIVQIGQEKQDSQLLPSAEAIASVIEDGLSRAKIAGRAGPGALNYAGCVNIS